jgi:hypothetical protein
MTFDTLETLFRTDSSPYTQLAPDSVLLALLSQIHDEFTTEFARQGGQIVQHHGDYRTTNRIEQKDQAVLKLIIHQGRQIAGRTSYTLAFFLAHKWHSSGLAYIMDSHWHFSNLFQDHAAQKLAHILSPKQTPLHPPYPKTIAGWLSPTHRELVI